MNKCADNEVTSRPALPVSSAEAGWRNLHLSQTTTFLSQMTNRFGGCFCDRMASGLNWILRLGVDAYVLGLLSGHETRFAQGPMTLLKRDGRPFI